MGEAERLLAAADKERRRPQVLLQQIEVLAPVMPRNLRRFLHEPGRPILHLPRRPGLPAAAPQRASDMLHYPLLAADVELMLAGIPLQPGLHHVAIQIDAGDPPALQLPALE
jgi:hypothetical protein